MSTLRTITGFKERLAGGGARPNLFEVEIPSFPAGIQNLWGTGAGQEAETFKFLCKAANLPASNINPIDVPFRGRILKVAGDRTIDPWTVTIINDEDFKLRTAFELWMNTISKLENNTGATNPDSYMTNALVHQLGRGANNNRFSENNSDAINGSNITPLRTYMFHYIFPTNIGPIDLSYDSADTIEEYTVEFQVQYWSAGSSQDNNSASDQTDTMVK
jgi:hypothetical protein